MQKLEERDTCTPMSAPQARSSVAGQLNSSMKVGTVLPSLKTSPNNSDVDQQSGKTGQGLRVLVLNMRGEPLMPTTPAKARYLLKGGKVRVIRRSPFTIQLNYATGEAIQPITLGIDAGYTHIGYSARTEKKELISGEVKLLDNVSKRLVERRMYRRGRRNRLWYRKPRFLNRVSTKKEGWLAPSIQHKLDFHIRLVEKIKELLPISNVIVEVASFDTQKMQNPEISGVEYQQGELQGYELREYLLEKWGRKCAYCGKKDIPLEIEHIIPKSRGGTNRVSNLTIACNKCNLKKGNKTAEEFGYPEIQKKANQSLRETAFMNNVRWRIVNVLKCKWTYGYITKYNRIKLELGKNHVNDAFVISGGTNQERIRPYASKQVRRNNRCLQLNRKGFKPSIRRQRYNLQPNDLVKHNKLLCRVKGVFNRGTWIRLTDETGNTFNSNIQKVELVKYGKGLRFA